MTTSPNGTSFGKTSRIAIVTTLVSIALNPISITIGYFLGQSLQAPKLKLEYVEVDVKTKPFRVEESLLFPIRNNLLFSELFKQKSSRSCRDWINSGEIDEDCLPDAIQTVEELLGYLIFEGEAVAKNAKILQEWDGNSELLLDPILLPNMGENIQLSVRKIEKLLLIHTRVFLYPFQPGRAN